MLWPDHSESRARANLSTVIWRVRAAVKRHDLRGDLLLSDASRIWLDTSRIWVDVQEFRKGAIAKPGQLLDLEALGRAVASMELYVGDLLQDWDYEWCVLERESLRELYLCTAEAVIDGFEQRHRWDVALRCARKAIQMDPYRERLQRALVRLLLRSGDRAAALAQISRFARLVRHEFGVELDNSILDLSRAMRGSHPWLSRTEGNPIAQSHFPPARELPLIGRLVERQCLLAALERARNGKGTGIFITGDAGMGKTRLLNWFLEEWAAFGGITKRGRCIEFCQPVAYHPVKDLLGLELSGQHEAHSVETGVGTSPNDNYSGPAKSGARLHFTQVMSKVEALTTQRPVLLVIEDVQWADAYTVDLVAFLLERANGLRLVVAVSASLPLTSSQVALHYRLQRCADIALRLAPLTRSEIAELVSNVAAGLEDPARAIDRVWLESEGNPFIALEVLKVIGTRNKTSDRRMRVSVLPGNAASSDAMPDAVRSLLQRRLCGLPPDARTVAEVASVLGRSFDLEVLTGLAGIETRELQAAVELLDAAGVFQREQSTIRFSLEQYRLLCYERLPPRDRVTYHQRAYKILLPRGDAAATELAWHQYASGCLKRAARWWEAAGDRAAAAYQYEVADRAYSMAAECWKRVSRRGATESVTCSEFRVLSKLDEVMTVMGRTRERREVLDEMRALASRDPSKKLLASWYLRAACFDEHVGNFDTAVRLARRAWHLAGSLRAQDLQVTALRDFAWALSRAGRNWRALAAFRACLRRARYAEPREVITALWQTAVVCIKLSDFALASACLERAKLASKVSSFVHESSEILGVEAIADKWMGRPEAAREKLSRSMNIAKKRRDRVMIARLDFHLATLDCLEGQLGQALCRLRRAIVASREMEYVRTHLSCLTEVASGLGRVIGSFELARMAVRHALRIAHYTQSRFLYAVCRDAEAQLLIEEGRFAEAGFVVADVFETLKAAGYPVAGLSEAVMRRGVISLLLGQVETALADLETAARLQSQAGDRLLLVNCLSYLAAAYAAIGNMASALAVSTDAVRLLQATNHANPQPQRIYWHHYLILKCMGLEPRVPYLQRAAELIETRAVTLSRAQQRRFKTAVPLNREILAAWEHYRQTGAELEAVDLRGGVLPNPMGRLDGGVPVSAKAHPTECLGTVS
ncbi:MAG: AAA family ATPase [Armatimonadota bacterium]|nr:AAA family ATPase [Armatimonadota bacterium]